MNNANIRVYTRFPGMYPKIAGVIVKQAEVCMSENQAVKAPSFEDCGRVCGHDQ